MLDLDRVPKGEELYEDLVNYRKLGNLCILCLRELDVWYITRLLCQGNQSDNAVIRKSVRRLALRIYKK